MNKKEYIVTARRNVRLLKQRLTDEEQDGLENISILLSDELGYKKGDKIKVTLEKLDAKHGNGEVGGSK